MLLTGLALTAVAVLAGSSWVLLRAGYVLGATLIGVTALHEALLITVPLIFAGLVDLRFENLMVIQVGEAELTRIASIEVVYVAVFSATLVAVLFLGRSSFRRRVRRIPQGPWVSWFLLTLVAFALVQLIRSLGQPVPTFEEATHHADVVVRSGLVSNLLAWSDGAFLMGGFAAAGLLVSDSFASRYSRLGGVLVLALLVAVGISEGYRGRVVWAASFLTLGAVLKRRFRAVGFATALIGLLIPISSFLAGPLRSLKFGELAGKSRLAVLGFAVEEGYRPNAIPAGDREPFFTNALKRAQGPRNSVVLLNLYDQGQAAGFRPLWGALILPVPRTLWPEKPPAGSIDHTNQGAATYLVRRLGWNSPDYNMGPFLASAHSYWEGGLLGVLLAAIASAFLWGVLLQFGRQWPKDVRVVLALVLLSALPIDGLFTMLLPTWVLVAKFWSSLLPLWLLAVAARTIWATVAGTRRWALLRGHGEATSTTNPT